MTTILAADVGGTKTLVAAFRHTMNGLEKIREGRYVSRRYGGLDSILSEFLAGVSDLSFDAACFGVAGAVLEGTCALTNLPWSVEESALAVPARAKRVKLLNDIEAAAYGMLHLQSSERAILNPPTRPERRGNVAVLAAGTGLGEAILFWHDGIYHPVASEGGHADFAPHGDREVALLAYLRAKYGGRVSYERVLSGPGLANIYGFLRADSGDPEPAWLTERLRTDDAGAVIGRAGLAGDDPACVAAVEMFAHIYGVEAGNLALKCLGVGGVYLGGGIAPKLLAALQKGSFMAGFTDKGRFSRLLGEIGVYVALNTQAPLIGAAHYALRLL